jgi:uncharacterized membrane protein YGL010W
MRKIDQLLLEYGESHQNSTNKLIHWLCVPAIMFSLITMLWSIPLGSILPVLPANWESWVNPGSIALLLATLYYWRLSFPLFLGMVALALAMVGMILQLQQSFDQLFLPALLLFAAAWVGQFIGHKIEGKKPSFFKDLQFLLIGPAWLMHFIFKKFGIPY